jgi:hypothetical protein
MTGLQHWYRYDDRLFTGQDQWFTLLFFVSSLVTARDPLCMVGVTPAWLFDRLSCFWVFHFGG